MDQRKKTFMARQAIFDRDQNIFGYELLFRKGLENYFDMTTDRDYASSKVVLDSFWLFDLKDVTRGKPAFMNFTARVLLSEVALLFAKDDIIIELLENVEAVPEVLAVCENLKNKGYLIALDDFQYHETLLPLVRLADIIKVDFLLTRGDERRRVMGRVPPGNDVKFVAEKVETVEDYNHALDLGYSYFQGHYFCRPVILEGREISSHKLNLLHILKEVHRPELSIDRLESIIKRDLSLSYKLLRYINSAAFGIANEIQSIRHAINLLGGPEFKKWMSLMLISQMGSDKPTELALNSLIRARFCELIAAEVKGDKQTSNYFLLGLFSLIDAFLDRPITEVLTGLPIPSEVKGAILKKEGIMGDILQMVIDYERSRWDRVSRLAGELKIGENQLLDFYFTALRWANDFSV